MRNPIENLGDYNKVRIDLQNAGGSKEELYKEIAETAIAKVAPKLLIKGGLIGAGLIGTVLAGKKGIQFMKDRKKKIENEPTLKEKFAKAVEKKSEEGEGKDVTDGPVDEMPEND